MDLNRMTEPGRQLIRGFENGPPEIDGAESCYLDIYQHPTRLQNFIQLITPANTAARDEVYVRLLIRGAVSQWVAAPGDLWTPGEGQPPWAGPLSASEESKE